MLRRRILLGICACISAYATVALVHAHAEMVLAIIISAALATWKFFARGLAWKKVIFLAKLIKPALFAIITRGVTKYFVKGVVRRVFAWMHSECEKVREVTARAKAYVLQWWQKGVEYWQKLPRIDKVLLVIATLPVAIVPLIYIIVTRAIRTFVAYKVGEAVTEKSVDRMVHHPVVKKTAGKIKQHALVEKAKKIVKKTSTHD